VPRADTFIAGNANCAGADLYRWPKGAVMDTDRALSDDAEAIKKVGEEFFAGVNAGDLDRRMATMDRDVIIMPPNRPPIVGKEEVRRLSREYAATFEEKCSLAYDEVEVSGHWGYVRATVTGIRRHKSGGGIENLSLKNLWIVKRQPDGDWKFWRIIFNSANPPAGT
jgi:ketosteroid isomerase-like protein